MLQQNWTFVVFFFFSDEKKQMYIQARTIEDQVTASNVESFELKDDPQRPKVAHRRKGSMQ